MNSKRDKTSYQERQIRLRLEILDELLGGLVRRTYTELLDKLNEKLEVKGEKTISLRTLKYDISHLETEQSAPIHRPTKKDAAVYYTEKFSLKDVGLSDEEVEHLRNAIEILKQVYNFQILQDVEGVIRKLENRVNTSDADNTTAFIHFEKQGLTTGHEHFENLLAAIKNKIVVRIEYQPYHQADSKEIVVHPYLLKEFRNRWFVFARVDTKSNSTVFALDRIKKVRNSQQNFRENDTFDPNSYFNYLIGVSVPPDSTPVDIEIKASKEQAPYLITKPIHPTQELIKENKDGSVILKMKLTVNYELKSTLLSYGSGIEVKKPIELRNELKAVLENTLSFYK